MKHFPIFIAVEGRRIVLSGGGDAALAKLRLLMKTEAHLTVFARHPAPEIVQWAEAGRLSLVRRSMSAGDALCAALFYAADEDAVEDARTAALARSDGALTNIVDNLEGSQFITPAIVDRDPVTVAIGTEGTAPVLARSLKAEIERMLPGTLGPLARAARGFRKLAEALPMGRARRSFWSAFFFASGPAALEQNAGADLNDVLQHELAQHLGQAQGAGRITFAVVASPDPEMLPQKTRRVLHEADLVLHDAGLSPHVLELARREAVFGPLASAAAPLVKAARRGDHVICLVPAPPDAGLIADLHRAGLPPQIIPGIAPVPHFALLEEIA